MFSALLRTVHLERFVRTVRLKYSVSPPFSDVTIWQIGGVAWQLRGASRRYLAPLQSLIQLHADLRRVQQLVSEDVTESARLLVLRKPIQIQKL